MINKWEEGYWRERERVKILPSNSFLAASVSYFFRAETRHNIIINIISCPPVPVWFYPLKIISLSLSLSLSISIYLYDSLKNSVTGWCHSFLAIWPFATMEIYPIAEQCTKVGSIFCQILNNPQKLPKICFNFAKVVKFRQIWSQCSQSRPTTLWQTLSQAFLLSFSKHSDLETTTTTTVTIGIFECGRGPAVYVLLFKPVANLLNARRLELTSLEL